jgi:hypothetical protein
MIVALAVAWVAGVAAPAIVGTTKASAATSRRGTQPVPMGLNVRG